MNDALKGFTEMSDDELLTVLVRGELPSDEKVRVVLAVRDRKVAMRHNRFLIILTVVMALATLVQALGVIENFTSPAESLGVCFCRNAGTQMRRPEASRQPPPTPNVNP